MSLTPFCDPCRTFINVQFLNLMAILQSRGGRVNVRVGGNSQDTATLVASLPNGKAMAKQKVAETDTVSSSICAKATSVN